MASEWEPILKDVISEVLETMFFAMVEFEGYGDEGDPMEYQSEVHLYSLNGRIVISLQVTSEFARMITADFMGIEQCQLKDDDIEDSLKELANMVGGGYHARVNDANWQLGIPVASRIDSGVREIPESATRLDFGFLGQPVGSAFLVRLPA